MKKLSSTFYVILWFIALAIVAYITNGCAKAKVSDGSNSSEVYFNCIVDSTWIVQPESTLEYEPTYYGRTDCGFVVMKKNEPYSIGDTVVLCLPN